MATQTMSRLSHMATDKTSRGEELGYSGASRRLQSPLFVPPNEFRMKLLKRILSVDGTIDNKALQKLQKTSTERTLQANIVFQNGDVGTLISIDRLSENPQEEEADPGPQEAALPALQTTEADKTTATPGEKRERPLKLPPIIMPPIHTLTPRPLHYRDFSAPVELPGPLTTDDWDELQDCRYLRPSRKQFKDTKPAERSFLQ